MTTYTINHNDQYNSLEIFFDGKPDEAVRSALKGLKFRWHRIKKCWYGFADEETVRAAIEKDPMEDYTVTTNEGYMGTTEWTGCNRDKVSYTDLPKAIREAFKKCGIKGVTVRRHSYSGGQSLYFTITLADRDLLDMNEFIKQSSLFDFSSCNTIQDPDNDWRPMMIYDAEKMPIEEQNRLIVAHAKAKYERIADGSYNLNQYYIDEEKVFTDQFKAKFHKIRQIVDSFNHDDTNSMVDYFDRDFYEHYKLKAC